MRKLLNPLKRISERAGRIILIHHTNAYGTRIADHTQLQAAVSQTILMTYQQKENRRIIKWESKGRGPGATRTFHLASPAETTFKLISLNPFENLDPRDKSTIPILNALATGPKSMTQIAMETKLTFKRVEKRIAKLLADGHIRKQPSSPHSMRQPQKYMTI